MSIKQYTHVMEKNRSTVISKESLEALYLGNILSMQEIATQLGCSLNRVDYWMRRYQIPRRSRSDARYAKLYPDGDIFSVKQALNEHDQLLFGLGIGLYWGEGNKANTSSVRLGNTDPGVISTFVKFLENIYGVPRNRLRFSLQLFSDTNEDEALRYWTDCLGVNVSQFYKTTVTISGAIGTYRRKNRYGVLTVYFNNKRLRDILVGHLHDLGMNQQYMPR